MQWVEARQKRESKKELFAGCKQLQAAGLPMSQIALRLGLNRRRLDKWAELNELPERKRMTPRPGSIGMYRDYLRQRWDADYRNSSDGSGCLSRNIDRSNALSSNFAAGSSRLAGKAPTRVDKPPKGDC
jgi:hypothetical protein